MTFSFKPSDVKSSRDTAEPVGPVTMELEEHNPRFMKRFKRFEPKIKDSTAMQAWKTCPRMYFYQIVLGRISTEFVPPFPWGSSYHLFREVLEKTYGIGPTMPPKFDEDKAQLAFVEAAMAGQEYWKAHGAEQAPGSKYEFMTLGRLLLTFKKAYEHWRAEKLTGQIVVIASEQPFKLQISDGSYIGGRADQMVRWNGVVWGRDFKTTTKDSDFFARSLEPNDQFTRYTLADTLLAGEFVQGQIVELMWNAKGTKSEPNKGPKVIQLTTRRTPEQLEEFEQEQVFNNRVMAMHRETDRWPMHEKACSFCPYHAVCKQPTEEAQMAKLEQDYTLRPWDYSRVGTIDE